MKLTTYQRIEPLTGKELTCKRCPPGYRLVSHCTATEQTQCALCPDGLYTECWNYVRNCLLCDVCSSNQVIRHPCTHSHNTVCECDKGYYWHEFFCKRHSVCAQGYAVKTKGTPVRDTECEVCPRGQYASGRAGQAVCVPHTDCKSSGQRLLLRGTSWHDNICATCSDVRAQGWVPFFRNFVHDFFTQRKMSENKLQRFVTKFLRVEGRRVRERSSQLTVDQLVQRLQEWMSHVGAHQVQELPSLLHSAGMTGLANQLEGKMTKIMDEARACSTAAVN
ncbi:tumor necrosis factor receptor superfamily member 6B [Chanos chanos]|uniref:Tumor necrosis factor receptor superfamily member 6B n=1 Tax=Chanos chanos TaxID=29144 RepID=A0A6J2WLE5_CHACN|nr:tumor necrosis factor receptor superfamily member 11B-like [Chanos chanos]